VDDNNNVNEFLSRFPIIVERIDTVLKKDCTEENLRIFTRDIPEHVKDENKYTVRRLLFLYFIYSKIIVGYNPITPIDELSSILWKLSCCFDFRFELEQFNKLMNIK
jgi:hypothetical protein